MKNLENGHAPVLTPEYILSKAWSYVSEPFHSWERVLSAVFSPFTAITHFDSKIGWPYLLSALLIAYAVFRTQKRRAVIASTSSFSAFLLPHYLLYHPSTVLDIKFAIFDHLVRALLYLPLVYGFALLIHKVVLSVLPIMPLLSRNGGVTFLLALVLTDFGTFFSHFLMHKVPVLWEFHRVHHSAEVLTGFTVFRNHPMDLLVNAVVSAVLGAIVTAFYMSVADEDLSMVTIAGVNIVTFLFMLAGGVLRHTNVWVSFGLLNWIIISPAQHQIHHSRNPKHWDKNFGYMLAVWDLLFRTLYVPRRRENLRFGVQDQDHEEFSSIAKLYFQPFRRLLWSIKVRPF